MEITRQPGRVLKLHDEGRLRVIRVTLGAQSKWALVSLPAPTAPEIGSPVPEGISFLLLASGSPADPKVGWFAKLLSVFRPAKVLAVRLRPAHGFSYPAATFHILFHLLALQKRSDQVSGISASVPVHPRRSALSRLHRCLTNSNCHLGPSRTTGK